MGKTKITPRREFTPEFKLNSVIHALNHSKAEAARSFSVSYSVIKHWCHQQIELGAQVYLRKWRNGRGQCTSKSDVDRTVYEWFSHRSHMGARITSHDIRREAQECRSQLGQKDFEDGNKWLNDWCKRYKINIDKNEEAKAIDLFHKEILPNREPPIRFTDDCRLSEFHKKIRVLHCNNNYQLLDVGIVSQTRVVLQISPSISTNLTIILSSLANGTKFPPLIIFKGDHLPPTIKITQGLHFSVSNNIQFGHPDILCWLREIWYNRSNDKFTKRRLLISSIIDAHTTDYLKEKANRHCSTDVVFVEQSQPDLLAKTNFLNTLFQSALKIELNRTLSKRITQNSCENQLERIRVAWWEGVNVNEIVDAFRQCDIVGGDDEYISDKNENTSKINTEDEHVNNSEEEETVKRKNDFLGFTQDDIEHAKKIAKRVYVNLYDELKASGVNNNSDSHNKKEKAV